MTISGTALTTGSALVLTGPSGGTAGVTDAALKIASDVGNIGTSNGLISSTATFDGTTAAGINLYLSSADAIVSGNTDYGIYNVVSNTGAITTQTKNIYGEYISATGTGGTTTTPTTNVYGSYITTTATHATDNGTVNQYGLYIADGTSSTNGTATKYGLYVESQTGAAINYAAIFAGGNVGIATTTPGFKLDTQGTIRAGLTTGGRVLLESSDGTADYSGKIYITNDLGSTQGSVRLRASYNEVGTVAKPNFAIDRSTNDQAYDADPSALTYTNSLTIDGNNGYMGLGDITPDYLLELYDATSTPIFALSDDDVSHGFTDLAQADVFAHLSSLSTTAGGAQLQAFSDTDATGFTMKVGIGTTDPTDTTPAIKLIGGKLSGTTLGDLAAAETVFQVANNDNAAALTILGAGNVGIGNTAPTAFVQIEGTNKDSLTDTSDASQYYLMLRENSAVDSQGTGLAFVNAATGYVNNIGAALIFKRTGAYGQGELQFYTKQSTSDAADPVQAMVISNAGNLGIGAATPSEKLHIAGGNVLIGAQADVAGAFSKLTNTTAGTITASGTANIDKVTAAAILDGSLYIGTSETDSAEVYRYDSGTGWTKISQSTAGTIAEDGGANTAIDTISSMMVYNGSLYVGTTEGNEAEVYRYDGSTNWTVLNGTAGTFDTQTVVDGVTAMAVYKGNLYIGTTETDVAQVLRYDGGTTWTKANATAGAFSGAATIDSVTAMTVMDNYLYIGVSESNQAQIFKYSPNTGTPWTALNGTAGTFQTTANIDTVSAMTSWQHQLIFGTTELNSAEVYILDTTNGTSYPFRSLNASAGTIKTTASIDGVVGATVLNGILYITTSDSTALTELYSLDSTWTWTAVTGTAGTYITTANIDGTPVLISGNNALYLGTNEGNSAEVYKYTVTEAQSYALKFNAVSDNNGAAEASSNLNLGLLSFVAENQPFATTGSPNTGAFQFSHGIVTAFGAYDIAEDYPTRDDTLQPGDLVSVDPNEKGFVQKSAGSYESTLMGVYSEKPGMRLSQEDATINGGKAIPIALAGRVDVKVSTESGTIAKGDYITSSSTPGVAMKATRPGQVIGKALESLECPEPVEGLPQSCQGKIEVFINVSFADPNNFLASLTLDDEGNLIVPNLKVDKLAVSEELKVDGSLLAKNSAGEELTPTYTDITDPLKALAEIESKVKNLEDRVATQSAKLAQLEATSSASPSANNLNLTPPDILLATPSATLKASSLDVTSDASISGKLVAYEASISNIFKSLGETFLGNTLVAGDLTIDGTLSLSQNSLNSLTTLYIQNSPLTGGVDFFNGKVTFDKDGFLIAQKISAPEVTTNKLTISNTPIATGSATLGASIGTGKIPGGQTGVTINTDQVSTTSKIFVTLLTSSSGQALFIQTIEPGAGFTVSIDGPINHDIEFNWWIVESK